MATALVVYLADASIVVPGIYQAIESAQLVKCGDVEKLELTDFDWLTHPADKAMRTVYVREVYKQLWDVIKKAHAVPVTATDNTRSSVLFLGNEGIGKSWSLNYLLHLALKEKLTSVVILRTKLGWYCFHDGECYDFKEFPGEGWVKKRLKPGERGLLLHDMGIAMCKGGLCFQPAAYGRMCIVIGSAPVEANYCGFERSYCPVKFYCPMLTRGEFESIYPQHMDEFDKYGGCLRGVGDASRESNLLAKINSFNFGRMSLSLISMEDSPLIVQVAPDEHDSERFHLRFVSKYVEKLFFEARWVAILSRITVRQ